MITVTKEFTFDAAHKLEDGYEGACSRIHGHTYKLQVTVSGELNKLGMVVDFKELKQIWKDRIEPDFDHQLLNDTLDFQTTAENMVKYIGQEFDKWLEAGWVVKANLWETPTSFATWINPDLNKNFKK